MAYVRSKCLHTQTADGAKPLHPPFHIGLLGVLPVCGSFLLLSSSSSARHHRYHLLFAFKSMLCRQTHTNTTTTLLRLNRIFCVPLHPGELSCIRTETAQIFYFSFFFRFRFYLRILIDKVKLIFSFLMTAVEREEEGGGEAVEMQCMVCIVCAFRLANFRQLSILLIASV